MKSILLTRGQAALVDDEDYEMLDCHKWCAHWNPDSKTFYARRTGGIWMHRVLLAASPGQLVDHRDHNGLNNQRYNIRICSNAENRQNSRKQAAVASSRFKGVTRVKATGKWRAEIRVGVPSQKVSLGYFRSEEDAALAYDLAAKKNFGSFCYLNFPAQGVSA